MEILGNCEKLILNIKIKHRQLELLVLLDCEYGLKQKNTKKTIHTYNTPNSATVQLAHN